jgi:hypothetical protein
MDNPIVNKVAKSPILNIDLKEWEVEGERLTYDLAQHLFQGLILKEKDFREEIATQDWASYEGKHVAVYCSADAIVPTWAFMVIASELAPFAKTVAFGSLDDLEQKIWDRLFQKIDWVTYGKKVVIVKGCSDIPVPEYAFVSLSQHLAKHARKLMFGEPCSTVPVYKK